MEIFRIEGWFPPIIFTSIIDDRRYAVCGSKWIQISPDMTIEEVMKGWICTAKDNYPKAKSIFPKKNSRLKMVEMLKLQKLT